MDPLLAKLADQPLKRRRLIGGGIAAAAVLVLVVAVLLAALQSGGSAAAFPAGGATIAGSPSAAVATGGLPTPTPSHLLVQVVGAVRHPGLVALPSGARAVDAIAAAGGATVSADEAGLNLAARVADGQQLVVPTRGRAAVPSGAASSAAASGPVSLSSATEEQLETLPRIGPAMAARIIAWREAHGGFSSVADLAHVAGIGPKTLADLQTLVVP